MNSLKKDDVAALVFGTDGKLEYFITENDEEYRDLDGVVEFWTDNEVKWTFKNRLLDDVNDDINSRYYYCNPGYFGHFTDTPYYMDFDCGYLKSYRTTDKVNVILTDIYDTTLPYKDRGWTYDDYVYYYRTVEDAKKKNHFDSQYKEKLYFSVKNQTDTQ